MKKISYVIALAFALSLGVSTTAYAQTFDVSLGYGSTQKAEVLKLQNFLYSLGYLKVSPTGVYLSLTQKAVSDFQKAEGVSPSSGYFGPLTRAVANQKTISLNTPSEPKAEVTTESVSDSTDVAATVLSKSKTIKWKTVNYPKSAGVNINLLRKISDKPLSYSLVRVISTNTTNDGIEIWVPQTGENTGDLFVEVTCSSSYKFPSGCQFSTGPIKVQ